MKAEIIAVGSELLFGMTIDTNSAFMARHLAAAGVTLLRKSVVDDDLSRITDMLTEALHRADLVICTGGLGPTLDDKTREAAALALGRPLAFRQELLDQVAARFAAMKRPMSENNRVQAFVPQGARAIENPHGTAPAFLVEDPRATLIVLPGVPREMRALFETVVLPYLRDERGVRGTTLVRTLYVDGLGESVIGECIADLMEQENPAVGTSAHYGVCELRLRASAESTDAASALLAPLEATLRERLGDHLTGDEPLDRLVVRLLRARGLSLALYEGNPHAPLHRALCAQPDAESPVRGVLIVPPTAAPAPQETLASLSQRGAEEARDRWQTHLAMGIQVDPTPGRAGFTVASITLVSESEPVQERRRFDLRQPEGWEYLGNVALTLLRRFLQQ